MKIISQKFYNPKHRLSITILAALCSLNMECSKYEHIQRIDIVSIDYMVSTVVAYPPVAIISHQRATRVSITDTSIIRNFEKTYSHITMISSRHEAIDARIVCLIHQENRIDTLSFGWQDMQLNNEIYSVDTTLLRQTANMLTMEQKESVEEFLNEYYRP